MGGFYLIDKNNIMEINTVHNIDFLNNTLPDKCAMSAKEKRRFVGYEITKKHAKMANERAKKILKSPTLF